jgi:hypothetical protein
MSGRRFWSKPEASFVPISGGRLLSLLRRLRGVELPVALFAISSSLRLRSPSVIPLLSCSALIPANTDAATAPKRISPIASCVA